MWSRPAEVQGEGKHTLQHRHEGISQAKSGSSEREISLQRFGDWRGRHARFGKAKEVETSFLISLFSILHENPIYIMYRYIYILKINELPWVLRNISKLK